MGPANNAVLSDARLRIEHDGGRPRPTVRIVVFRLDCPTLVLRKIRLPDSRFHQS